MNKSNGGSLFEITEEDWVSAKESKRLATARKRIRNLMKAFHWKWRDDGKLFPIGPTVHVSAKAAKNEKRRLLHLYRRAHELGIEDEIPNTLRLFVETFCGVLPKTQTQSADASTRWWFASGYPRSTPR